MEGNNALTLSIQLLIGTDSGLIRVYNTESQSIVQTFRTDETLPK